MSYLLDTMVVSETFKRHAHAAATHWLRTMRTEDSFISAMTFGELERGLAKAELHDPVFASRLALWIERVERRFSGKILPANVEVARTWGRLAARVGNKEADLLIAATALVHDLTVVTRNVRHFERTGVPVLNPYEEPA